MPSSSPSEMPSSSPSAMPSSSPSETPSTSPTVNKCFFLRTFGTNPPRTYSDDSPIITASTPLAYHDANVLNMLDDGIVTDITFLQAAGQLGLMITQNSPDAVGSENAGTLTVSGMGGGPAQPFATEPLLTPPNQDTLSTALLSDGSYTSTLQYYTTGGGTDTIFVPVQGLQESVEMSRTDGIETECLSISQEYDTLTDIDTDLVYSSEIRDETDMVFGEAIVTPYILEFCYGVCPANDNPQEA